EAESDEVALPDRRVRARVEVDQGVPPRPARPPLDPPLARPLPWTRRRGTRIREAQERLRARAAPHARPRPRPAARRPRHARAARAGARPRPSRPAPAGGVAPPRSLAGPR